jgi:tripartite-type tricarboxylate transporter receptor subunit TctC
MALFLVFLLPAVPAGADPFYKGKAIRLIVSSSPGGGNDTYSRLIARHIGRHIPGNPSFVVQNMPGGGGLIAANYLYLKAPKDGTVMEQINWGVWYHQVIKNRAARFDFNKMNAVGVAMIENTIFYTRSEKFKTLDDIEKSGKLAKVSASGKQSSPHVLGNLIQKITGKKYFKFVFGYPGARQYSLAVRQGEVDGSGNTVGSGLDQLGDMFKSGELTVLVQAGNLDGSRGKEFPDAPSLDELAKTPKMKAMVKGIFLLSHYGRPYSFPPGVPKDRIKLLRDAFMKTMKDPKFLSEAKRIKRPIEPLPGSALQKMWKDTLNPSPEQLSVAMQIFGGKK